MDRMNIKGAIFDVDGTLINSLIFWDDFYKRLEQDYFKDREFVFDTELDKKFRTNPERIVAKLLHEHYGIGKDADEMLKYFKELCFYYYRNIVELKAGVKELLEHLKQNGVKMAIATASELEYIKITFERHGIGEYFDHIVCCSEVGASKDKPDVFFEAERRLGTPHESTWIFEDSLLALQTSKNAGFKTVGIYDECAPGCDIVHTLSDEYIGKGDSFTSLIPKI